MERSERPHPTSARPAATLADALGVRRGDVIALVGGGGKTSALYRLGSELGARGWPVLLSGSARFTPPERGAAPRLTILADDTPPAALPARGPWPLTVCTGHADKGRLRPITPEWLAQLRTVYPDWTVVLEADGSAMRPFKAPAPHEPVIPPCSTLVVPVVGLDVLGRPLDDRGVHRAERAATLARVPLGTPVDEQIVARVLLHSDGGRKGVPAGARWTPLLNKADAGHRSARAGVIAGLVAPITTGVVVASLREGTFAVVSTGQTPGPAATSPPS